MGFATGVGIGVIIGSGLNILGGLAGGWYRSKEKERERIIFAIHLGSVITGLGLVALLKDDAAMLSGIKIATIATTIFSSSLRFDCDSVRSYVSILKTAKLREAIGRAMCGSIVALAMGSFAYGCRRSLLLAELTSFFWGNITAFFWDRRIDLEDQKCGIEIRD